MAAQGGIAGGGLLGVAPPAVPWWARLRAALAGPDLARPAARAEDTPDRVAQAGLLVWTPVLLSAGIGLWFSLTVEPGLTAYAAAAAFALAALSLHRRVQRGAETGRIGLDLADTIRLIALGAALVAAGFLAAGLRAHFVAGPVMDYRYYGPIEGRVVAIDRSARDRMRITLEQLVLRDTEPARTPLRVRLSLTEPQPLPAPGAHVMLTGHLGPPPGPAEPGGFDFRRAAFFEGMGAVGYTRTPIMTVIPAAPSRWDATPLRLRLSAAMQAEIGGQEGAVAAALMTGDRSGIAEATNQTMRDSNLYHIVSISGLHMSMLAGFVYAAMRVMLALALAGPAAAFAGRPTHKAAAVAALGVATVYLWLSGGGVPTERAYLMVAVMLAAILADRRAISLRTVAVAAIAILLIAPEALVTPGFQMSFAATASLILLFPAWSKWAGGLPWWVRWAVLLVISSLIAGLATSPIAAAHFNRSAQYGLVANLAVVPVMGVLVMPAGVIAALLAPVGLAGPALWVMGLGTRWMLFVGETVAGWGGSVMAVPAPHWTVLPLMGGGATVLVLLAGRQLGRGARVAAAVAGLAIIAAIALWVQTPRPVLLVAGDGSAAGLMTPQGRALSKLAGAFVADSWLRADGDVVQAEAAAARPGWEGPKAARRATVAGRPLIHLSGKNAAAHVGDACAQGGIVVLAGRAGTAPDGGCLLLDERVLARSGARAAYADGAGLRWVTVGEALGARLWSSAQVRRSWGYGGGRRWPRDMPVGETSDQVSGRAAAGSGAGSAAPGKPRQVKRREAKPRKVGPKARPGAGRATGTGRGAPRAPNAVHPARGGT